jgi:hypothetical protein
MPNGVIEKLTSLEDLQISSHRVAEPFGRELLGKLRELRVLKCSFSNFYEGFHSDLVESLCNLQKFRHLDLDIYVESEQVKDIWDAVVLPRPLQQLRLDVHGFRGLPPCIKPSPTWSWK